MIGTLAILLIPLSSVARAESCKLTIDCPFENEINDPWIEGARLEQTGDFDAAIIQYQKALDAAQKLNIVTLEAKQNQHLGKCAATGSEARLVPARAGRQYLRDRADGDQSVQAAIAKSQQTFRLAIDQMDIQHPDLASSCP
ncbi:hypothetical protein [Microcoleus sp. bin38.metabat.b11b12b14.051]|uniref:hypothetical protein n=1 Tax=Microcoleus sp. bin38.metabat.b11b12b14.051 TaxID=2742709 RepID=UPI0025E9D16B|nr:hypothetical protein [Microcoleus sp. bin38.metabat.b11b12b14.051]